MVRRPSRTILEKVQKIRPSPTRPGRIPEYFGPFLDIGGQTDPIISSASRFPAGGAGQNSIWSHEAANQTQNHDFGRSRFWPISVEVEAVGVEAVGVEAVGVKSHVLRGWRCFFFFRKNARPGKTDMPSCHFGSILGRF